MSGNKIDPNKIRFFELGYDSLIKNNDLDKFVNQLQGKRMHAKRRGDLKGYMFFTRQKELMRGKK